MAKTLSVPMTGITFPVARAKKGCATNINKPNARNILQILGMCLQRRRENTLSAAGKDAWFPTDVLGVLASFNGPFWNVDRDISVRVTVRLKVCTCRAVRIFTTLRENNQKYQQMLTSHHLQRPRRFWSGRQGLVGSQSHSSQERQFSFSFRNNQARLSPHNTRWWQQTAANSRELYLAGGSRLTGNGSLLFFGRMGRGGLASGSKFLGCCLFEINLHDCGPARGAWEVSEKLRPLQWKANSMSVNRKTTSGELEAAKLNKAA